MSDLTPKWFDCLQGMASGVHASLQAALGNATLDELDATGR